MGPPSTLPHPPPPTLPKLYAVARAELPERLSYLGIPPADVDDIIHEVVLIARNKLDTFVPTSSDPERSLRGWLYGIAWRYASRQRGRAYRRLEVPMGDVASLATSEALRAPSAEQLVAAAQRRLLLGRVLATLRPERAKVLVMHAVFEMPAPVIAEALNVNENTVKSRLQRARRDAAAAVERLGPEEREALRGSLLLPWIMGTSWPSGSEQPPANGRPGLRAATVVALAGAIAAGMAMRSRPSAPDLQTPIITAALDALPLDPSHAAASAVLPSPSASSPPPTSPHRAAPPADRLARELALLKAARQALEENAPERAAAGVRALDREIPVGALAKDRALLREDVTAQRRGTARGE